MFSKLFLFFLFFFCSEKESVLNGIFFLFRKRICSNGKVKTIFCLTCFRETVPFSFEWHS